MDNNIKELLENIEQTLEEISKLSSTKLNSRVNNVGIYERISRLILISAVSWIFGIFLGILGMASFLKYHSDPYEQQYESIVKMIDNMECKKGVIQNER